MDLSNNGLTGEIPPEIGQLNKFNLFVFTVLINSQEKFHQKLVI